MKIIHRSDDRLGLTTTDQRPERHEKLMHPWPSSFEEFLTWTRTQTEVKFASTDDSEQILSASHGASGCVMAWTKSTPLQNSWRVAAHHSSEVAFMTDFNPAALKPADGILTKGINFSHPLAIFTADCMAIAVTLEKQTRVHYASCFHAGWRGYVGGIQQVVLEQILRLEKSSYEVEGDGFYVTIGPAIAGVNYPCGPDVLNAIREHHDKRLKILKGWTPHHERAYWGCVGIERFDHVGKVFPDLQSLLCIELHALGINLEQVAAFREDTYTSGWWPSHRRAMKEGLDRADRLITHLCPSACS